jgi:hypothetical protein
MFVLLAPIALVAWSATAQSGEDEDAFEGADAFAGADAFGAPAMAGATDRAASTRVAVSLRAIRIVLRWAPSVKITP